MDREGYVSTRVSSLKFDSKRNYENVVFSSHKKRSDAREKADKFSIVTQNDTLAQSKKVCDLRKLRNEVVKLASTGLGKSNNGISSADYAIALGAKPRKNEYKNYKKILTESKVAADSLSRKQNMPLSAKDHLYVVGNRTVVAKPRDKRNSKKFLHKYGKVSDSELKKKHKKGK